MPSARAADPEPFIPVCTPIDGPHMYNEKKFASKATEALAAMRATGPAHVQIVSGPAGHMVCGW